MAIRRLKAAYVMAKFVGDGINDAPVLAESDGAGDWHAPMAVESADVVTPPRQPARRVIALSKATIRNIHLSESVQAFATIRRALDSCRGSRRAISGMLGHIIVPARRRGDGRCRRCSVLGNACGCAVSRADGNPYPTHPRITRSERHEHRKSSAKATESFRPK